jgi:hypothetical protein
MANIKLQDLNVIISGVSRYNGGKWDSVHVETMIVTDEPLSTDSSWYVPAGITVPPEILAFFQTSGISMYPTPESTVLAGTEDIREQAEAGNLGEVQMDAAKLMMRAILKKTPLTPVADAPNTYLLSYDYKLYPVVGQPTAFDFKIRLPFDGLRLSPQGGRVQVTVLTPIGATVDPVATIGIDENRQEIVEQIVPVANAGRSAVSFGYQLDPDFTIRYTYPS